MLIITVPAVEGFDDEKQEFVEAAPAITLELEHSLVSLSSWESKWEEPFLGPKEKTNEQALDYIRCMTLNGDLPEEVLPRLTEENMLQVQEYINAKMTATWFNQRPKGQPNKETITAELIYYWMFSLQIPKECEHWHINRLFTLIKVFDVKNSKPEKLSRAEILARNKALNEQRRKQYETNG